ncbi:hypothetical protein F5Y16DRAFT_423489 [Xylariaceae sp. FL0255]|nr:hypothetical protein F5Y16DRAFT_423489 [Xylariaceae sp. FL0255]
MASVSRMPILAQVIESCLSSSHFGDQQWKLHVLQVAERVLSSSCDTGQGIDLLRARVALRVAVLKWLASSGRLQIAAVGAFPVYNRLSNARAADMAIWRAGVAISVGDFEAALSELDQFDHSMYGVPSTFEKIQGVRFVTAIIQCSISELEDVPDMYKERACSDLVQSRPQYWVTGLSLWKDFLAKNLRSDL